MADPVTRSGSNYSAPRDANRVPLLMAASTSDGITPVVLEADPSTHSLSVSASVSPPSDTTATGNITSSGSTVIIALNADSTVGIQVSGTFSATLLINGSVDGTNYSPTTAITLTTGIIVTSITSAFTGQINTAGMVSLKISVASYTSGTAVVSLRASSSVSSVMLDNPVPTGTNTIGAVGINAGTNAIGTVGSNSGAINVGQKTSNTSAVQLSSSSTVPANGIIVQALAANTAKVYIGGSGVLTTTGFELQAGQAVSFTCNLNTLYVIGSNNTDGVCWTVD
jgi:hypothetical protein